MKNTKTNITTIKERMGEIVESISFTSKILRSDYQAMTKQSFRDWLRLLKLEIDAFLIAEDKELK